MKISKRDAKLLLILVGVVVFLLSYLLVFNRYNNKRDEVAAQLAALQPQLSTLEGYYSNLATYQTAIDDDKTEVKSEMDRYPTEIKTEDQILYAMDLEKNVGIKASALAFTDPVLVNEFKGIAGQDEAAPVLMDAYQTVMNISCDLTYPQLKALLHYIYATQEHTSVSSVSVSYDAEKAELTGTVGVCQFYLTYPGAEPEIHGMPAVPQGTTNLFGSVESAG